MSNQQILNDLAKAKAIFQTRAVLAVMETKAPCPVCGAEYPLHEWNCSLNQSSKGSDV